MKTFEKNMKEILGDDIYFSKNKTERKIALNKVGYKLCHTCETIKKLDEFGKGKYTWDGKNHACLSCMIKKRTTYKKTLTPEQLENQKKYTRNYQKSWRANLKKNDIEKFRELNRKKKAQFKKNHPEKFREMMKLQARRRRSHNAHSRIRHTLAARMVSALQRQDTSKKSSTFDLI